MNFKQMLLGSALAVTTFGLVACGGDSGSNADPTPPPSSASQGEPYVPPQNTEYDVIAVNGVGSNVVGEAVFLAGSFSLKLKEPYTICQPFRKRETVFAPSLTDVECFYG